MFQPPNLNRVDDTERVFVSSNPTSFGSAPSDDFTQNAHGLATPTRNLVRDATAYGTEPTQRSQQDRRDFLEKNGGVAP